MKRSTATWSTAIAAAALLAVPASGWAQATPSAQGQSMERPASAAATQQESGQEHLRQAKETLNDIPEASLTGPAKTRIAELKRHISALESSAASHHAAPGQGAGAHGQASWSQDVAAIDRIVAELLGSGSATGMPSATGTSGKAGTPGAVGTSGSTAAAATLDEESRAKLQEVRIHITAFAGAMSARGSASGAQAHESSAMSPSGASATTASPAAAEPSTSAAASGTQSSATSSTSTTQETASAATTSQDSASTPQSTSPATPPASSTAAQGNTASGEVDTQAVKRHLTAARNSLSQLTQLPAAAQLTGDARTQVSQLISNFNHLITTDTGWRAEYTKVQANLDALLGDQRADESAATPAPGAAGAVGTSGTVSLDPAIRSKLVEFRSHLSEFEKAAGGAGEGSSASASTPTASSSMSPSASTGTAAGSSTPAPSAAASSTMESGAARTSSTAADTTSSTSPSSTAAATGTPAASPTATGTTGTPGSTPTAAGTSGTSPSADAQSTAAQTAASASQAGSQSEAMRHIEAIEAILSGRSGSAAAGPSSTAAGSTTGSTAARSTGDTGTVNRGATGTSGTSTATGDRTATAGSASTLDRADIEQIRTHLNELRRVLSQGSSK